MRKMVILAALFVLSFVHHTFAQRYPEGRYLYKTLLLRAAPGKLLELIELYRTQKSVYDAAGEESPFWMRHSQGDHWDIMLLFPMESYRKYYQADRITRRQKAADDSGMSEKEFTRKFEKLVAWHEAVFVWGAPLDDVKSAFEDASYFHVEMFQALPGKHEKLYRQRQMENVYLKTLKRPQNLIFVHDDGAAWDIYTLGCYRDIKHFAESADIPEDQEEEAAVGAGFEAASRIGTYLRTLIRRHNDTLAVRIR